MTKNRWRSVDTHLHDGAGSMLRSLLPIWAANTSFITTCNLSPSRLPKTHDKEPLTLHWHSFSRWGRKHFIVSFPYIGSQYFVYDNLQLVTPQITHVTCLRIIDAPFTFILPLVYQHDAIIEFGTVYHLRWFGSLSNVYIYFFLITPFFCNDIYEYISFKIYFTVSANSG